MGAVSLQSQFSKAQVALTRLESLCATAENAFAELRKCHAALMSHAVGQPTPVAVDVALIAARNAALTGAQHASSALTSTVQETDLSAVSAASQAAIDRLHVLLHKVAAVTGAAVDADGDCQAGTAGAGAGAASAAAAAANAPVSVSDTDLKQAMARLDAFTADIAAHIAQLGALQPVTLASLATGGTLAAIACMRKTCHALLLDTGVNTLTHYLTYAAPWQRVCRVLAVRSAALQSQSAAITNMVSIATQLQRNLIVWSTALEERKDRVKALKAATNEYSLARRKLLIIRADAEVQHYDYDSDDDAGLKFVALPYSAMQDAKRACNRASLARDAAAQALYSAALAFYPETLVQKRDRLLPGGVPPIVSQRSREDYEDIKPFVCSGEGRHALLRATFDGEPCVLKVVPISGGSALAHEAGILKAMDHPNIVKLLAVFVEDTFAYLHMAHACHGDLKQFLTTEASRVGSSTGATMAISVKASGVLPARQLQRLSRQLCDAVAYLAERSIVHCDIKPANIFIDGQRDNDTLRAVLGDFDVSHTASSRTSTLTRSMTRVATHYTPGYAPPEVLHASTTQPPRVSPAIDVYSLGCVIFAMHMFPRTLPEPTSVDDVVASNAAYFSPQPLTPAVAAAATAAAAPGGESASSTPVVADWVATVPRDVVLAATCPQPRARASARELLHKRYMLDASGSFAHVSIQRPAYWLHQYHMGSWLEEEPEETRVAVENVLNHTAEPATHGIGADSHKQHFQRFKVTRVQRLENPAVWVAYAAQRRQLADTLMTEGYTADAGVRPLATETCHFVYPVEGGSLEEAAGEVFLFHGTSNAASIAFRGFDVRHAFAGTGAGAMFGRGVYFAESASKADQYVGRNGKLPLTMVVARVLLGRGVKVTAPRSREPFLPKVASKTTETVPVYYDSLVADMRPQGMRFREIVVGDGLSAYPELFVDYERV
jgi:serine/threonine protein kinase